MSDCPVYCDHNDHEKIVHVKASEIEKLRDMFQRAIKVMEYYQHDEQIGQRARDFLKEVRE